MNKRLLVSLVSTLILASGYTSEAQQPKKVPRIGFMIGTSPSIVPDRIEGFRQGLRDLGYVEGKNIIIEYRVAKGKVERLPDLLAELVRLKVDVIVTGGIVNHAAKAATKTIPIVIAFDWDPVASGLVVSLARPGGNITGLSALYPELSGKQLELLKETVPRLSRVAVFGSSIEPNNTHVVREWKLRQRRSECSIYTLTCKMPKILRLHFEPQARNARTHSWCWRAP